MLDDTGTKGTKAAQPRGQAKSASRQGFAFAGRHIPQIFAKYSGGGGGVKSPSISYLQAKHLASSHSNSYQVAFSQPYVYDALMEVHHASEVANPRAPGGRA